MLSTHLLVLLSLLVLKTQKMAGISSPITLLLSPLIEQGMRAALPPEVVLQVRPDLQAHVTAARLAVSPEPR